MTSIVRAERLHNWLTQVVKLETENYELSVEFGKVKGEFIETSTVEIDPPLTNGDKINAGDPIQNYLLTDSYTLSLVVRKQLPANFQDIKLKLLLWLAREKQQIELSYDAEKNNQDTYDYFFDMVITEHSHDEDGAMKTC